MSEPVLLALVTVVGAVLGALIAQAAALRRAPAQARLDDAQAEKAECEADILINDELRKEIDRLSLKVTELERRVVESERRATSAEARLAEAESKASESRRVIITLGEKLDKERADNERTTEQLVILIERLLTCIETPAKASEIDMPGIQSMIRNIRSSNGLPRR